MVNGRLVVLEKSGLVERRLEGRLVKVLGLVWDGLSIGLEVLGLVDLEVLGLMVWTDLNLRMVVVVVWVLIDLVLIDLVLIDLVRVLILIDLVLVALVRTGLRRIPALVRG